MKALLSIAVSTATFFAARCDSSRSNQQSTLPDAAIAAAASSSQRDAAFDASFKAMPDATLGAEENRDAQPSASSDSAASTTPQTDEPTSPSGLRRPWRNTVPTPSISPAPGFAPSTAPAAQPPAYDHHPLHAGSLSGFAQGALLSPLGL